MNKIVSKYRSAFLSFGFLKGGTTANGGVSAEANNESAQARCARGAMRELAAKKKECAKDDTECRANIETAINDLESDFKVEESKTESRRKDRCESLYEDDKEIYKECAKVPAKQARSCSKTVNESGGFMQSDEMQSASSMLGMVSGADTLLGIYSAMNDRPDCTLSKDDFKENENKLEDQKKDLEEKVKVNMKDAEDAQTEYADKLKSWAEAEGKIADRLNEMPNEKEDAMHKLDNEKLKAKMQADSKYSSIVDQIAETRRKYTDMISAKAVALSENSSFAIHDRCAIVATGGDPAKQNNASAKPTTAVQGSFAGAFAQGKTLTSNIQKRYDNCINTETLKQKRIESTFVNELAALKSKLTSYDSVLGQINEEKRLADQEIIYQMQNIEKNATGEAKKLAAEYQRIQTDKTNEQSLLKQKLERLNSETKKYQQQIAILAMKLSMYSGKRPAKYSDDKSMADMLNQCGEDFKNLLENFHDNCCKPSAFSGTGSSVCRMSYSDYSKPAPPKVDKNAKPTKKVKGSK
ncbi:MAG: hypothetical protein B7Y39_13785 [Bdellovibrio sp. 28-41-41]|nr:MAG: hypothetical protein B7Y39_13785 [Bdellovibrio sp. 28-41-41]